MDQKVVLTSLAVASVMLAFSYVFINRNVSDDQQALSAPNSGMTDMTARTPQPERTPAITESRPEQRAQLSEGDSHDEPAVHLNEYSIPPAMINQELLSSLNDEMKAQYLQALEADWKSQVEAGRKVQEMQQGGGFEKPSEEQARLFSVAATLEPGAGDNADATNIEWQPAEDEFAMPEDEQFYGAEVDAACADDMCKLQFQGFDGEESRDSAIDKLITDKKIPQNAMIMPDETNPGRFIVIYPKKQS